MARHRKRGRRRHYLSNPFSPAALLSKPKEMVSKEFVTEAVSVAAGFMGPNIVMGYLPAGFRDSKLKFYASKVLVVAGLSAASGLVSKKASRFVLIGGGVSLLLDLWAEFRARTVPAAPAGTSAYYGENMGAYYGNQGMGDEFTLSDEPESSF